MNNKNKHGPVFIGVTTFTGGGDKQMKKIHWLRRLLLLVATFGVGAAATGVTPTWIKIVLCCGMGGYLLLMAEFEYEQQKKPTSAVPEVSNKKNTSKESLTHD